MDFSSWPREQEATFVVYEERASQSQKKAWTVALATAAIVFVAALGIYAGVEPDKTDISKGDRQFELIATATTIVRDTHPAVSPDGAWLVFASTRERASDATSLWIARLGVEVAPVRLTDGPIDSHPSWTADGRAIVFASTRDGGDYDLWQLPIRDGAAAGPPVPLTSAPGHEVQPTIARDGTIVYAAVDPTTGASQLAERMPDGDTRTLTPGPADSAPALSPDGATIVFARPQARSQGTDAELWQLARTTGDVLPLVDLPLTDETGPVWSRDGRYVFATSLLRGADGRPLFSSVVFVDRREPARARMLRDRAGPIARLTPALTTSPLDATALRSDPEYLPELARIMAAAISQQRSE